jgi:hypothetical protein
MPAPTYCTICERPDRDRIDAALRGGTSIRQIAQAFDVGRTAVTGHAAKHTQSIETRKHRQAARGGRRRSRTAPAVELRAIEGPEGVVEDLQRLRVEAFGLFEAAKGRGDWKSAERIFSQLIACVDRFGELHRVLGGKGSGLTINVDRSQRVFARLDAMTDEQLRALQASLAAGSGPFALAAAEDVA